MGEKTILVVDDEKKIRELLELRLTSEGYDVLLAQNGEEGVDSARKNKPDLIIMDVMMPRMDGPEAVKIIQEDANIKDIPIIFLTSIITKEEEESQPFGIQLEPGKHRFFAKPFDTPVLLAEIKKIIGS